MFVCEQKVIRRSSLSTTYDVPASPAGVGQIEDPRPLLRGELHRANPEVRVELRSVIHVRRLDVEPEQFQQYGCFSLNRFTISIAMRKPMMSEPKTRFTSG
jgi:hypothetical protein